MSGTDTANRELWAALEAEDWDRVEELWLEALDAPNVATEALLEAPRQLWSSGHKTLARTLLELLAETLEAREDHAGALATLRELVRLNAKVGPELKERLEKALRGSRAGSPSLDRVLEKFPIHSARRPLEVLATVEQWLDHDVGTVVEVRGHGVGTIVDANLELDNINVDVGNARPISVPFGAAGKYLRRLPRGGFLHRKVTDRRALEELVLTEPGEALVALLEDLEEPANVGAIKAALADVLPPQKWTSWWAKARKHPRIVSKGAGSRLRYQATGSAEDATEALLEQLKTASPRRRLALVRRLSERGREVAATVADVLSASLGELEAADPGLAWETAIALSTLPGGAETTDATLAGLIDRSAPAALLGGIEDRTARGRALAAIRENRPGEWPEIWAKRFLEEDHPALLDEIVAGLDAAGRADLLDDALEVVFRNPHKHGARFIWACETMTRDGISEVVAKRMTPSVLEHLPDTLTHRSFAPYRARAKALLEGGRVAIRLILEKATPQQAQRFADRLARVSTLESHYLRLIQQAAAQRQRTPEKDQGPAFVATRRAVEQKRAELKQLLEVDIPRTLKGIQAAAAEGDLRENFEYHMLRDRQELQSARAAKLQQDLARVKILEPGLADTSRVNIGTRVRMETLDGQSLEPIAIVGQWDADVDRRLFANGTDLAETLLGRQVGDEVEVNGRNARILAIEPWDGN